MGFLKMLEAEQADLRGQVHGRVTPVSILEIPSWPLAASALTLSCADLNSRGEFRVHEDRLCTCDAVLAGADLGDLHRVDPIERQQLVEVHDVVVERAVDQNENLVHCAFGGICNFSASSTARTPASACTAVQAPQNLPANSHASRGSRPIRMFSMPRHMVPDAPCFADTSANLRDWIDCDVRGHGLQLWTERSPVPPWEWRVGAKPVPAL
jgi:hypothetical protein